MRIHNTREIFNVWIISATSHTKHIDIRYKYMNEYVEDWKAEIVILKSAENNSKVLSKNLSEDMHKKHSKDERWEAWMIS